MKKLTMLKSFFACVLVALITPMLSQAQPAGPGDGSDPFATPVNGYIAFVAVIAFIYGAFRIYQLAKSNKLDNNRF